jgi:CDP-diglyceride synthetase
MDDVRPAPRAESIPLGLWSIALVALSPFPLSALAYCYGPGAWVVPSLTILLAWSATTLAFLGGVRWGLETREPAPRVMRQAFSFLCAVAAVVILLARGRVPDTWILGGLLVAFLIQWLFDHHTPDTPSRYPLLSTAVTGAACVSLALALEKAMSA